MTLEEHIRARDMADTCRQVAYLLASGMGLLAAVEMVRTQMENAELKEVLLSVEADLRMGRPLHTAFARFPQYFSPFFLAMLREGERNNALRDVLLRLADHLDRERFAAMEQGWGRPIVVRPDMSTFIEELRPLLLNLLSLMGALAVLVAALWYSSLLGWLDAAYLGPNISLLVGVFLLTTVLLLSRYRPPEVASCNFCGVVEGPGRRLIRGEGKVFICDACLETNVRLLKEEAERQRRPFLPPSPEEVKAASEAKRFEELEQPLHQEFDFQFYKPEEEERQAP